MMKLIIYIIMALMMTVFVVADFDAVIDDPTFKPSETITLNIETLTNPQKGNAYIAYWYNSTDGLLEQDDGLLASGTLPDFTFETYTIPSIANWTNAYVNVTSGGVTQQVFFNVSGSAINNLIISDLQFAPDGRAGKEFAVEFTVKDSNEQLVSNARCTIYRSDSSGAPLQKCEIDINTYGGSGSCANTLNPDTTDEGSNYLVNIQCNCGIGELACFDDLANTLEKKSGSIVKEITVPAWLEVNTITDSTMYTVDDDIYVCVNVTNNFVGTRLPIRILYNWRCQNGASDASTDRIIIAEHTEERGISGNTTQNQCAIFKVPDSTTLEKGATNCYAASSVNVLSKNKEILFTYDTTSPLFTLNITHIHPTIEWKRVSREVYIAEFSIDDFDVGVKDIEVAINPKLTYDMTPATRLINYSVQYTNGSAIAYDTEGEIEREFRNDIEEDVFAIFIEDVNTTLDESFNVTITLDTFEERDTVAQESILTQITSIANSFISWLARLVIR